MKKFIKLIFLSMIISVVFCRCSFLSPGSSNPVIKNYLPSAPVNLQACDITSSSAKLLWSKSVDPDGSVTGYNIYLGLNDNADFNLLDYTSETEFNVDGLAPDTPYYFFVKAVDNSEGESEASNEIHVRTNPYIKENLPPEAPENLHADQISYNEAALSWAPSGDYDGSVTGYNIYVSMTDGSGYSLVESVTDTTYSAAGLEPDTSYYFVVMAVDDDSAESEASGELHVRTLPAPDPPEVVFYPANSASDTARDVIITITFEKPVRMLDDSEITDLNAADLIIFKEDNMSGPGVSFTAAINAEKTVITVVPTALLGYSRAYYAAIESSVEDSEDNAITASHIIFTTVPEPDTTPPVAAFYPADSSSGAPVNTNIIITFNEPVRLLDKSEITNDNAAPLFIFKEDEDTGADLGFTASINADRTEIIIDPDIELAFNRHYFIGLKAEIEDYSDNPAAAAHAIFKTLFVVINEALYDSAGSDTAAKDNFVELYGMPGLDLTGWKIICYNAPSGPYITVDLNSRAIPSDGFFVVGEASPVPNCDMIYNGFELQNGPDSIRLVDPSGAAADTLGYSGSDTEGPYFFYENNPAPAATNGKSLSRNADHRDTDDNSADFTAMSVPTPGY